MNTSNKAPTKTIPFNAGNGQVFEVEFNPVNTNEFYLGSYTNYVKVYDFGTGKCIHTIDAEGGPTGAGGRPYSMYGNMVCFLKNSMEAHVTLTDCPSESLTSFCSSSGQALHGVTLTSTSAIVAGSGSILEFKMHGK